MAKNEKKKNSENSHHANKKIHGKCRQNETKTKPTTKTKDKNKKQKIEQKFKRLTWYTCTNKQLTASVACLG